MINDIAILKSVIPVIQRIMFHKDILQKLIVVMTFVRIKIHGDGQFDTKIIQNEMIIRAMSDIDRNKKY